MQALKDTIAAINAQTVQLLSPLNSTSTNTLNTKSAVDSTKSAVDQAKAAVDAAASLQNSANALQATTNTLLDQIKSLNDTSKAQLQLLTGQYSASPSFYVTGEKTIVTPGPTFGNNQSVSDLLISNTIVTALSKIVANTGATAFNTFALAKGTSNAAQFERYRGIFASGGWIDGPSHASGGVNINAEGGEYMVNKFAAASLRPFMEDINRGRLPVLPLPAGNDNGGLGEIIAEIRALRNDNAALQAEVADLKRVIADGANGTILAVREAGEGVEGSVEDSVGRLSSEMRRASDRPVQPGTKRAA